MLDTKDIKIINLISKDKTWKNNNDLISQLGFSRGDFYYHLKHLNLFLKNNKISQINLRANNKEKIKVIIKKYEKIDVANKFFLNSEQRTLVLIILLVVSGPIKLKDIKNYFNISINTAYLDIQSVIYFCQQNFGSEIKVVNNGKGYFYLGNEFAIRKLIVNVSIMLVNFDNFILIRFFLLTFLSNKNIAYNKIEKIVSTHYFTLPFINMELKTISLIIFILLCRDQNKLVFPITIPDIVNEKFYSKQTCYHVAKKLFLELKSEFCYDFTDEKYEIFYFAIFLSSPHQFINCESKILEFIEIMAYLKQLFKKIELKGYQLSTSSLMINLINYLHWQRHLWDPNLIFDYSGKIKQNIFLTNHKYYEFYLCLKELTKDISKIIFLLLNDNNQYELTLQFLPYILKYPISKVKKSILITNNKGGTINVLILKIKELLF